LPWPLDSSSPGVTRPALCQAWSCITARPAYALSLYDGLLRLCPYYGWPAACPVKRLFSLRSSSSLLQISHVSFFTAIT
jgi:hypothetical protein